MLCQELHAVSGAEFCHHLHWLSQFECDITLTQIVPVICTFVHSVCNMHIYYIALCINGPYTYWACVYRLL